MLGLRSRKPVADGLVHYKSLLAAKALCGVIPAAAVDLNGRKQLTCPACAGMLAEIHSV